MLIANVTNGKESSRRQCKRFTALGIVFVNSTHRLPSCQLLAAFVKGTKSGCFLKQQNLGLNLLSVRVAIWN